MRRLVMYKSCSWITDRFHPKAATGEQIKVLNVNFYLLFNINYSPYTHTQLQWQYSTVWPEYHQDTRKQKLKKIVQSQTNFWLPQSALDPEIVLPPLSYSVSMSNGTVAALLGKEIDQGTRHQCERTEIQLQWNPESDPEESSKKKKTVYKKCIQLTADQSLCPFNHFPTWMQLVDLNDKN